MVNTMICRYDAAKCYQENGYIIHPLSPPDSTSVSPGKKPILSNWQKRTEQLTDDELVNYFKRGSNNIGLVCGKASGVMILDIDKNLFVRDLFDEVDTDELCISARTKGRMHLHFQYDESMKASKNHVLGLELLTDGNNAVLPGSTHMSGEVYRFRDHNKPPILNGQIKHNFNQLHATYRQLVTFFNGSRTCFRPIIKHINDYEWHGSDNREFLIAIVADLKAAGAELRHINMLAKLCYGQDFDANITSTEFNNIQLGRTWKCSTVSEKFSERVDCSKCAKGINTTPTLKQSTERPQIGNSVPKFFKCDEDSGKHVMLPQLEIVDMILKDIPCMFPSNFPTTRVNEILVYKDGIFREEGGLPHLYNYIAHGLGIHYTSTRANEILKNIASKTLTSPDNMGRDLDVVVCENCRLNIKTGEVTEHDPKYKDTLQIPTKYDPGATCPNFDEFITEIVNDGWDTVLPEIGGYCLLREDRNEKMVMMLGGGANGKSTLLNIYTDILGGENVQSMPLQTIEHERFALSQLNGKLANMCGDLPKSALKDASVIKRIISEDPVTADVKNGKHVSYVPHVKLIFAANKLARSYDDSDGFYRKILLIEFPNKFKVDPNFNSKFDNEKSGILNRMIEGAHRIIENDGFSKSNTVAEIAEKYIYETQSISNFIDEHVERGDFDDFVTTDELYDLYMSFCDKYEITVPENRNSFAQVSGKQIQNLGGIHIRRRVDGVRYRGYKGIIAYQLDDCD